MITTTSLVNTYLLSENCHVCGPVLSPWSPGCASHHQGWLTMSLDVCASDHVHPGFLKNDILKHQAHWKLKTRIHFLKWHYPKHLKTGVKEENIRF